MINFRSHPPKDYIQKYWPSTSLPLPKQYTSDFEHFLESGELSIETLLQLIAPFFDPKTAQEKKVLLQPILEQSKALLTSDISHFIPGLYSLPSEKIVEEIACLICKTRQLTLWSAEEKKALSFILSAYLLAKLDKPYFILEEFSPGEWEEATTNPLKMRVALAEKYPHYCIQGGHHLFKLIEFHGDSASYQSLEGREVMIIEWHAFNAALNQWKKELN